jgi:hypothetical protein
MDEPGGLQGIGGRGGEEAGGLNMMVNVKGIRGMGGTEERENERG